MPPDFANGVRLSWTSGKAGDLVLRIEVPGQLTDSDPPGFHSTRLSQLLQLAMRAGNCVAFEFEPDTGKLWFVSPRTCTLEFSMGQGPFAALGTDLQLSPEDQPDVEAARLHAAQEKTSYETLYRLRRPDGSLMVVEERGSVLLDPGGRPSRIVGAISEVTHREHTLSLLQESEKRFRLVTDSAPVLIWMGDPLGELTFLNWTATKYIGEDPSLLMRRGWHDRIHPEDLEAREQVVLHAKAHRQAFTAEFRLQRGDGAYRWMSERAVPRYESSGQFSGYVGTMTDITERRLAEEEIRHARHLAEIAARIKTDFLANISHEIRTPMNGILGMIEITLRTDLTPPQRDALQVARTSAETLLRLLDDILDFSRLDAGKLVTESIPYSPGRMLEETMLLLAPTAHAKGLETICRVSPSVPSLLLGDPHRVRQVVLNLIGNAVKFTKHGYVHVALDWLEDDPVHEPRLRFTITDTGIGIPAEKLRTIFEPFVQADASTTRQYGGSGLGLAISSRLAHLLGGQLDVQSEPGHGSQFHFLIPAHPAALPPQSTDTPRIDGKTIGIQIASPLQRLAVHELISQAGGTPVDLDSLQSDGPDTDSRLDAIILDESARRRLPQNPDLSIPRILLQPFGLPDSPTPHGPVEHISTPLMRHEALCTLQRVLTRRDPPPQTPDTPAQPSRTQRLRILVAEDHPTNRLVAERMVEALGHKVVLAEDGAHAVEIIDSDAIDVALIDIQMPIMDGLEVITLIRAREQASGRPRIPAVALTANVLPEDRERYLRAGFDAHLPKPIPPADLEQILSQLISGSRVETECLESCSTVRGSAIERQLLALCEGDRQFVRELATVFLESAPATISRLERAIAQRDPRSLCSEAHALKGICLTIGADELANLAARIHDSGKHGDFPGARETLLAAQSAWQSLQAELRAAIDHSASC